MADSVVEIVIRARNELSKTIAQVKRDIEAVRASLSDLESTGAADSLQQGFIEAQAILYDTGEAIESANENLAELKDRINLSDSKFGVKLREDLLATGVAANDAGEKISETGEEAVKTSEKISKTGGEALKAGEKIAKVGEDALHAGQGMVEAGTAAQGFAGKFSDLEKAATRYQRDIKGMVDANKEAVRSTNDLKGAMSELGALLPRIGRLARIAAGGFLSFAGAKTAKSLADAAARTEVLGTVLRTVAANSGIGAEAIKAMEQEVKTLGITTDATRESLTRLIQANLVTAETSYQAAELARAAQNLAVTSGQNSSETFSRLIVNIQQLDTLGLRYQGLIVDRTSAEKKFAEANDLSVQALTKNQKQQAFLNATLEEAEKLTGIYELSMQNVGKQIGSLARFHEELAGTLGETLLPAYSSLVLVYTDFLKEITKSAEAFDKNKVFATELGKAATEVATILKNFVLAVVEVKEVILVTFGAAVVGLALKAIISLSLSLAAATARFTIFRTEALAASASLGIFQKAATQAGIAARFLSLGLRFLGVLSIIILIGEAIYALGTNLSFVKDSLNLVKSAALIALEALKLMAIAPLIAIKATQAALAEFAKTGDFEKASAKFTETWRVAARDVIREIDNAKEVINTFGQGDPQESQDILLERAKDLTKSLLEQQASLVQAKEKLRDFRNELAELSKDPAYDDTRKQLEADIEFQQEEVEKLADSAKATAKQVASISRELYKAGKDELNSYSQDLRATTGAIQTELAAARQKILEAEDILFSKSSAEDPNISSKFGQAIAAFETISNFNLNPLERTFNGVTEIVGRTTAQVADAFVQLAKAAQSPEEIAAAIKAIPPELEDMSAAVKLVKRDLEFRAEAESTKELENQFTALAAKLQELGDAYKAARAVQSAWNDDLRALSATLVRFGASAKEARNGAIDLSRSLATAEGSDSALARLSLDGIKDQFAELKIAYERDKLAYEELTRQKQNYIKETVTDEEQRVKKLKLLDTISLRERSQLTKKYYDDIRKQRQDTLQAYEQTLNRIKQLDQELLQSQEDEQQRDREARREGLTEIERYYESLSEFQRLGAEAKKALDNEEYERAKELYLQQRAISEEIASNEGIDALRARTQASDKFKEANRNLQSVIKTQRAEEVKTAEEQKKTYDDLTKVLAKVANTLKSISGEQRARIVAELDSPSFTKVYDQIDDLTNPKKITFEVEVDDPSLGAAVANIKSAIQGALDSVKFTATASGGGGQQFATGGEVRGPGTATSDSILARLSNGEFVMRAAAVRQYGADLFHRLNRGILPPFKDGGEVSTTSIGNANSFSDTGIISALKFTGDKTSNLTSTALSAVTATSKVLARAVTNAIQHLGGVISSLSKESSSTVDVFTAANEATHAASNTTRELVSSIREQVATNGSKVVDLATVRQLQQLYSATHGTTKGNFTSLREALEAYDGVVSTSASKGLLSTSGFKELLSSATNTSKGLLSVFASDYKGVFGALKSSLATRDARHDRDTKLTFPTQMVHLLREAYRSVAAFSTGGFVSGPGTSTSDSIPARLSAGEYVVKADAVRQYGVDFLQRLNDMRVSSFSTGGVVTGGSILNAVNSPVHQYVQRFAEGGLVVPTAPSAAAGESARDVVDINLKMGDKRVTLMGERRQMQGFVDMLSSIEGTR